MRFPHLAHRSAAAPQASQHAATAWMILISGNGEITSRLYAFSLFFPGSCPNNRDRRRGYEYQRGRYVTFTPDELKALDLESSKVIDLEMFVSRGEVDPVYFNSPYYLYPDGEMAVEAVRVIGAAMAEAGVVGIGRLTLSRRERMVMIEPRGTGMALITLRAFEEVRPAEFIEADSDGAIDTEMLAIARAIIDQRTSK